MAVIDTYNPGPLMGAMQSLGAGIGGLANRRDQKKMLEAQLKELTTKADYWDAQAKSEKYSLEEKQNAAAQAEKFRAASEVLSAQLYPDKVGGAPNLTGMPTGAGGGMDLNQAWRVLQSTGIQRSMGTAQNPMQVAQAAQFASVPMSQPDRLFGAVTQPTGSEKFNAQSSLDQLKKQYDLNSKAALDEWERNKEQRGLLFEGLRNQNEASKLNNRMLRMQLDKMASGQVDPQGASVQTIAPLLRDSMGYMSDLLKLTEVAGTGAEKSAAASALKNQAMVYMQNVRLAKTIGALPQDYDEWSEFRGNKNAAELLGLKGEKIAPTPGGGGATEPPPKSEPPPPTSEPNPSDSPEADQERLRAAWPEIMSRYKSGGKPVASDVPVLQKLYDAETDKKKKEFLKAMLDQAIHEMVAPVARTRSGFTRW